MEVNFSQQWAEQVELFNHLDDWSQVEQALLHNFITQMIVSGIFTAGVVILKNLIAQPIIKLIWAPMCSVDKKDLDRFVGYFFNFFIHCLPAFSCLYVVQREGWLDTNVKDVWVNYPNQTQPLEYLGIYFMCNGYHFYRLLSLFGKYEAKDFVEMSIHHGLTVFLLCTSMMLNYVRIGILVLMVNDQSDLWVYLAKGFGATRGWTREYLSKICLVLMMGTWFYWRIYMLGYIVIPIAQLHPGFISGDMCVYALGGLLMLNVYWFSLFVRMAYRLMAGKGYQDLTEEKAVDGKGFSNKDGTLSTGQSPISPVGNSPSSTAGAARRRAKKEE